MYGTVSTAKKAIVEEARGIPIDYTTSDFVVEVKRLTGQGVDAVLDPIGGAHLARSYRALNPTGTLVLFGAASAVQAGGSPLLGILKTVGNLLLLKLRPDRRHVRSFTITDKRNAVLPDMARMIAWLELRTGLATRLPASSAEKPSAIPPDG